ncbi:MAG: family 10 glycosylhydrolase [Candidatus Omnitrophota bacterium]
MPLSASGKTTPAPKLGIWITVFSEEKVLYSKENVDRLINTCKKCGITDIYLQIYRADKAYYNSDITDCSPYENILVQAKEDLLKYLIEKANTDKIKIHAWLNLLCIAQNTDANILKKYGNKILTMDQYGNTSYQTDKNDLDKIFIREKQIFLEPAEDEVVKYLISITEEVIKKYPGLSGVHLDYLRYPEIMPLILGSRFSPKGLGYGYGKTNIEKFKNSSGFDITKMDYSRENFQLWDDWRRRQVTTLLKKISARARSLSPDIKISCTIVPSIERSYLVTFQDWTEWLNKGYADYVIAMNYTTDTKYMVLLSKSLLAPENSAKTQIGIGAYLFKNDPAEIEEQLSLIKKLSPGGIVIFSYDEIAKNKELQKFLAENFL